MVFPLKDRADPRDRRPLEYPLRSAFPLADDQDKNTEPQLAVQKLFILSRIEPTAVQQQGREGGGNG